MAVDCEVLHEYEVVEAPASGADEPVEIRCIHCDRRWPVDRALPRLFDWQTDEVYGEIPPEAVTSIFDLDQPTEEFTAAEVAEAGGSNCCHAPMRVESSDDGTSYGVCTACGKPADGQAPTEEPGDLGDTPG